MTLNWTVVLLSSLIPLVVGFIYYNKNVFGKTWMAATGMTEEKAKSANMVKIFGLSILYNVMLAIIMPSMVIHQYHIGSLLQGQADFGQAGSASTQFMESALASYGNEFRSFKHGALHGFILSLFVGLPMIGTASLYEMRGAKYNLISWGYWAISLTIMGGIICQFA
jgi:Protein of unknown function (DUF1761)